MSVPDIHDMLLEGLGVFFARDAGASGVKTPSYVLRLGKSSSHFELLELAIL